MHLKKGVKNLMFNYLKLSFMKKLFFILFLFMGLSVYSQQTDSTKYNMVKELKPDWDRYVKKCNTDSILLVYWEYKGNEQKVIRNDSINGQLVEVNIIQPTMVQKWTKPEITFEGFEKFLKQQKK